MAVIAQWKADSSAKVLTLTSSSSRNRLLPLFQRLSEPASVWSYFFVFLFFCVGLVVFGGVFLVGGLLPLFFFCFLVLAPSLRPRRRSSYAPIELFFMAGRVCHDLTFTEFAKERVFPSLRSYIAEFDPGAWRRFSQHPLDRP